MQNASINYNCGCGYKTVKYTEAADHVEKTGHSIDVSGKLIGEKKAKRKALSVAEKE
jgi:hypothetical protein